MRTQSTRETSVHGAVHWIWVPRRALGAVGLIVLAVGLLASWVFAYAVLCLPLLALFGSSVDDPLWIFIALAVIACLGPAAWIILFNKERHWRIMRTPRWRSDRLAHIADDEAARERLPHRCFEHCLRSCWRAESKATALLRRLQPRQTIVLNGPRNNDAPRPVVTEVPFEPIDLTQDMEQALWLTSQNLESQGQVSLAAQDEGGERLDLRAAVRAASPFLRMGLFGLWAGYIFYDLIRSGSTKSLMIIAFLFVVALVFVLSGAVAGRRWWLVPGGLLCREHRSWRRTSRVSLFTPQDTPLVIDLERNFGAVVDGQRVRRFGFMEEAGWVIIAGWISRARRPTEQELLEFVGPDAMFVPPGTRSTPGPGR